MNAATPDEAVAQLREFRHWRESKDEIVMQALRHGIPIWRIVSESGLHVSVIYKIRREHDQRASA